MLYRQSQTPKLADELFLNPTSEYRGAPFWAWNGKLEDDVLGWQIDMLKTMGMGGFHMHVRTGMDSPYLDEGFMQHIRFCVEKAKKENMLALLYDEDRWPSGTAGGKVTALNPAFAKKSLMLTCTPYAPDRPHRAVKPEPGRGSWSMRQDNGELLAVYDVVQNADGTLASARRIAEDEPAEGCKWYAYAESAADDPWFNDHPYVDTLNPDAIASFISLTHEKYAEQFGDEFGDVIPSIFTDEPQFTPKQTLGFALEKRDVFLPWTGRLLACYQQAYGEDLLDTLPQLVWELPDGKLSRTRYRYHNLVADLFNESFCTQTGNWCRKHGLNLTGHVNGEQTLDSQTKSVGDAMRCYPAFGMPGVDMLCDFHEYNTVKQTQSIVRQQGHEGMLSELYGVTGWDYDFRGYKLQGDWQAALGVTLRVPHLTWMTMKGEAKRDYPASIGYQSPWWTEFSMVENHFARLNTALTRGQARVRVGVIHPVESFWLHWGPADQTAAARRQMEEQFASLTETLLFGLVDFDFISESCLPQQCPEAGNPLRVGRMAYDAVIVCGSRTLRSSTIERLNAFRAAGGDLIFIGDCPDYVDAEPSSAVQTLYQRSRRIGFGATAILAALDDLKTLDVRDWKGQRVQNLICQHRQDGNSQWLFIANGKNPVSPDVETAPKLRFAIRGEYRLTEYDTLTGAIRPLPAQYADGKTVFERNWHMHDSLLLCMEEGRGEEAVFASAPAAEKPAVLMKPVAITLDEPNMLLLDMAEWSLDGSEYRPMEELLRLDNAARSEVGIPLRRKEIVQPYLLKPEEYQHFLTLRFTIPCEYAVDEPVLALEEPQLTQIRLNSEPVPSEEFGWYVDRAIRMVKLPPMPVGENVLELRVPLGRRTNLEWCYLLGDFGVRVNGVEKAIVAPARKLGFGSIVSQGLPFYTGNLNYHFDVETQDNLTIRIPHYRGGLVKLLVDGEDRGNIAFSPYKLTLDGLTPGVHHITLKLFGTRRNGFGQLHHTQGIYFYQSPNSWRSAGDYWSYEYQFKPHGILKSPEIIGLAQGSAAEHITDRS